MLSRPSFIALRPPCSLSVPCKTKPFFKQSRNTRLPCSLHPRYRPPLRMLAPRRSLHRLRTVFTSSTSQSSSTLACSPSSHEIMTPSTSTSDCPRTPFVISTPSWDSPSQIPWTPDAWTPPSIPQSKAHRAIRKKKSVLEVRQQEERQEVRGALLGLIEPRPGTGVASGGIEEVLHGEV